MHQQVGGDDRGRCSRALAEDPGIRGDAERDVALLARRAGHRAKALREAVAALLIDVGVVLMTMGGHKWRKHRCGQCAGSDSGLLVEKAPDVTRQEVPFVNVGAGLALFEGTHEPLRITAASPKAVSRRSCKPLWFTT
jgi:calcineurin-like phosphoesterase